jgi:hypothetical protein
VTLKDLDDRLLPGLARRAEALVNKLPRPSAPQGPAPLVVRLRRFDDRLTARGPLALLRDVPQLGAVAIGALILASGVTVKARTHPKPAPVARQSTPPPDEEPEDTRLGPQLNDNVTLYVAQTREKLVRLGAGQPDGTAVAVVMFRTYQTPARVRTILGPLQVRRIFYRPTLPLSQSTWHTAAVEDVVRDSRKEFARLAAIRKHQANELLRFAATIDNDPAQKAESEKDAHLYQREERILRGPCACIYAAVVRTRLRLLLDLLHVREVRAVDIGRSGGLMADYEFSALLPEEKSIVTGGNQAG